MLMLSVFPLFELVFSTFLQLSFLHSLEDVTKMMMFPAGNRIQNSLGHYMSQINYIAIEF